MESLISLEYIIERERHNSIGREHQPGDAAYLSTASSLSEYLRGLFHVLPTLGLIVRPFNGVFDTRH